jgi:predicted acylesterase/phospholipase RssA
MWIIILVSDYANGFEPRRNTMFKVRIRNRHGRYLSTQSGFESTPPPPPPWRVGFYSDSPRIDQHFWMDLTFLPDGSVQGSLRANLGITSSSGNLESFDVHPDTGKSYWIVRGLPGRALDLLWAESSGFLEFPPAEAIFVMHFVDGRPEALTDSTRIALNFNRNGPRDARGKSRNRWLTGGTEGLLVSSASPAEESVLFLELLSDLNLYYHDEKSDHLACSSVEGNHNALREGYRLLGSLGRAYMGPVTPDLVPMTLYYNPTRNDSALVIGAEALRDATQDGYRRVRTEGYAYASQMPSTLPLRTYFNTSANDSITLVAEHSKEVAMFPSGYRFLREDGFILPPPFFEFLGMINVPGMIHPGLLPGTPRLDPDVEPRVVPDHNIRRDRIPDLSPLLTGRNGVALVLSGGGAKGAFEVGAVQHLWNTVFREHKPRIITGVSVGALNAAKLAEGRMESADELAAIWSSIGTSTRIFDNYSGLYGSLISSFIKDQADDLLDVNGGAGVVVDRFGVMVSAAHSVYSMAPLRNLIHSQINPQRILDSGIQLRVGITDVKSGQYFSVTEPMAAKGQLRDYGRIELEHDSAIAPNWLGSPIYGSDGYAMALEDAVYCSSIMPAFMDPAVLNLIDGMEVVGFGELLINKLPRVYPPYMSRELQAAVERHGGPGATQAIYNDLRGASNVFDKAFVSQQNFMPGSGYLRFGHRLLFDGGLRDTMAIRTAMRLGAKEIYVVTGDRLATFSVDFQEPQFLSSLPDYLISLLGIWNNEAARTDILQALSLNEFLGWLFRTGSRLSPEVKRQVFAEFDSYWSLRGKTLKAHLGAGTWIGGDRGFSSRDGFTDRGHPAYGVPFSDEGCVIKLIYPPREILGARDMHNVLGIRDALELGRLAAREPIEISAVSSLGRL